MDKSLCRNCVYGNPPRDGDSNKLGYCKRMLLEFTYNAPGCYWFEDEWKEGRECYWFKDKNKEGVNDESKKD